MFCILLEVLGVIILPEKSWIKWVVELSTVKLRVIYMDSIIIQFYNVHWNRVTKISFTYKFAKLSYNKPIC